ncbi:MAG: efflux RND transporter periplasmic adaptor subunit [Oceanipulchritudo sp.]
MNHSVKVALGIFLLLCLYMLTGLAGCGGKPGPEEAGPPPERPLMSVRARDMQAEVISREVMFNGKTNPSRSVDIKAETSGRVMEVADLRGRRISVDQLIARIELNDRPERLEQARASLEQAGLEYEAAMRLEKQALRSESAVAEALARLRGAEQLVRSMELEMENTRLLAPFDGILQERMVEVGDYLGIGDPVARVIDLDPLIVEGEVTEFQIGYMKIGESGFADLADGRTVEGVIRYVAGEADPRSRTFTVEMEVPNPDLAIPAGITATVRVETERVPAYRISTSLISVADDGRLGIKLVDEEGRVRFREADIVRSEPDSIWVTGLPSRLRLITLGQDFTQPGDRVEVVLEAGE